jgi:hypothetical protein
MRDFQIGDCTRVGAYAVFIITLIAGACATDRSSEPATDESEAALSMCFQCSLPKSGLYATFAVGTETFQQQITSQAGIDGALALWNGTSTATIPTGKLACKCIGWNCVWDFHMVPESVTFTQFAIEVCDGTPSYVNGHCSEFGIGTYCPWSAKLIALRDCRTNPSCPPVTR